MFEQREIYETIREGVLEPSLKEDTIKDYNHDIHRRKIRGEDA